MANKKKDEAKVPEAKEIIVNGIELKKVKVKTPSEKMEFCKTAEESLPEDRNAAIIELIPGKENDTLKARCRRNGDKVTVQLNCGNIKNTSVIAAATVVEKALTSIGFEDSIVIVDATEINDNKWAEDFANTMIFVQAAIGLFEIDEVFIICKDDTEDTIKLESFEKDGKKKKKDKKKKKKKKGKK